MDDFIHSQGVIWIAHVMRRLANHIVDASDAVLVDYGITVPSSTVSVVHLLHSRGPQTVMTIAGETAQSHQLINVYVKLLKELGLVETCTDPADRRRTSVALTAAGEEQGRKLVEVRRHFVPAFEKLMRGADAEVFDALWRLEADLRARSFADRIRDEQLTDPLPLERAAGARDDQHRRQEESEG